MASLRKHPHTAFWYLRKRDLDTGVWREESTGLRIDSESETRKAQRLADKATAAERQVGAPGTSPAFLAWVPGYMATHWREGQGKRYVTAWQALRRFLAERDVVYPRQVRYEHGTDYLQWRMANAVHNNRSVSHNTALLELKFLAQLMNEAVRRQIADSNPLQRLGIIRDAARVKPEFTDDHIAALRSRFANEPDWMRVASEISLYTGCRFSETEIPCADINLTTNLIRLTDSKRKATDARKHFLVPLHPKLRPLLAKIIKRGAERTVSLSPDKNGRINRVIKDTVGDEFSFHCYRVTFVTRCHRSGLSESEAMRLVNHSSKLIHQIYSRLNVEDVRKAQARIQLP